MFAYMILEKPMLDFSETDLGFSRDDRCSFSPLWHAENVSVIYKKSDTWKQVQGIMYENSHKPRNSQTHIMPHTESNHRQTLYWSGGTGPWVKSIPFRSIKALELNQQKRINESSHEILILIPPWTSTLIKV